MKLTSNGQQIHFMKRETNFDKRLFFSLFFRSTFFLGKMQFLFSLRVTPTSALNTFHLISSSITLKNVFNLKISCLCRKIAPLLQLVDSSLNPPLVGCADLPKYEFVQDIEDYPDIVIQESTVMGKAFIGDPIDSFWYFELEQNGAEAPAPTVAPKASMMDSPPIAPPGSYQLFLPDPEMMDRVGILQPEDIFQTEAKGTIPVAADINIPIAVPVVSPSSSSSTASGQSQSRSESKQRSVVFADPPVSGSQDHPDSVLSGSSTSRTTSSSLTRIVSYQRPKVKERSRSRNTRIAAATQQVNR